MIEKLERTLTLHNKPNYVAVPWQSWAERVYGFVCVLCQEHPKAQPVVALVTQNHVLG